MADRVRASVRRVDGVRDCQVDHIAGLLTVSLELPGLPTEEIAQAVRNAGYALVGEGSDQEGQKNLREGTPLPSFFRYVLSERDTMLTAAAGLLTLLGRASSPDISQLTERGCLQVKRKDVAVTLEVDRVAIGRPLGTSLRTGTAREMASTSA